MCIESKVFILNQPQGDVIRYGKTGTLAKEYRALARKYNATGSDPMIENGCFDNLSLADYRN